MRTNFKGVILGAGILATGMDPIHGATVYWVNPNGIEQGGSGTWKSEFDGAMGHLSYTFDLNRWGTNLSGNAIRISGTETNVTKLTEARADDLQLFFVEPLKINGQELRIAYTGQLSVTNGLELLLKRVVNESATNEIVAKPWNSQTTVTGKWDAEFDGANGHFKYTFNLRQEGDKISGRGTRDKDGDKIDTMIMNGKLSGDEVSFSELGRSQEPAVVYKGKLSGDEIKFTRTEANIATNEITAKREK